MEKVVNYISKSIYKLTSVFLTSLLIKKKKNLVDIGYYISLCHYFQNKSNVKTNFSIWIII